MGYKADGVVVARSHERRGLSSWTWIGVKFMSFSRRLGKLRNSYVFVDSSLKFFTFKENFLNYYWPSNLADDADWLKENLRALTNEFKIFYDQVKCSYFKHVMTVDRSVFFWAEVEWASFNVEMFSYVQLAHSCSNRGVHEFVISRV